MKKIYLVVFIGFFLFGFLKKDLVVLKIVDAYDDYFKTAYCLSKFGEDRKKIVNQSIIYTKFLMMLNSDLDGKVDIRFAHARLALNEQAINNNSRNYEKYIDWIKKDTVSIGDQITASQVLDKTKNFDAFLCNKY